MGKGVTGCGRPQAASMPHRTEMGIHAHFPLGVGILLRNRRRKRARKTGTGAPAAAVPQKNPSHASASQHCIQAEL